LQEKDIVISGALSKDSAFLAVNVSYKNPEIHLWDLKSYSIIKKFEGHY
jgi:hypothetical protein